MAVRYAWRRFENMVEIDARVGGGFAIHEQRGGILETHFGDYREIVRPRRIVFTFGSSKDGPFSVVTVDINTGRRQEAASRSRIASCQNGRRWTSACAPAGKALSKDLARATGEEGDGHTLVMHRTFDAPRILV